MERHYNRTYQYILVSPEGIEHNNIKNIAAFCREYNLTAVSVQHLVRGYQNTHKGWTIKHSISDIYKERKLARKSKNPVGRPRKKDSVRDAVVSLYNSGIVSCRAIAKHVDVGYVTVATIIKEEGLNEVK